MSYRLHLPALGLAVLSLTLAACDALKPKPANMDLYALPSHTHGRIDNDAYYVAPVMHCKSIADSPSCGI